MSLETALDKVVDEGNDDELFIASYLQGHLALIAKPMEVEQGATLAQLDKRLQKSLKDAFENNELEANDQEKVSVLWQSLKDSNAV